MVAFFLVLACVLRFAGKGLSLLGEVDRASTVDNQRRRGAAIARFQDRVVRKPDRIVSRLHQIESYQNLSEDQEP